VDQRDCGTGSTCSTRREQCEYVRHSKRARRPGPWRQQRGEQCEYVRHSTGFHGAHAGVGSRRPSWTTTRGASRTAVSASRAGAASGESRGHPATRLRARAVREALAAATLADAGPAADGIAGVGPAADCMATPANFVGFDTLAQGYQDYRSLPDAAARWAFLDARTGRHCGVAVMYEMIRKFNHMFMVGRCYDTQEDLGTSCILIVFTEDAVAIARTVFDDASASCQAHYCLYSALAALRTL
jgi:hypothetical protein